MGPKEIFIGPCSKYIDGQGWTTEIPVKMLEEKGYVKAEELQKKVEQDVKHTAKEITSKVVDLNIICGDDFRLFLYNFELWVKERYGVEVE